MRHYLTWSGIIILWIAFIVLAWLISQNDTVGRVDFRTYYVAAQRLRVGESLYTGVDGVFYVYPPLLAQILIPFVVFFSFDQLWIIWFGLNVALLIFTVVLLNRPLKQRHTLWLITPLFIPILVGLYIGQVTVLLMILLVCAWLAVTGNRCFLGGALLALAAWIKVFPALLIVYFAWKRDWKTMRGALLGGIFLGIVQIIISGITPLTEMMDTLFALNAGGQAWTLTHNASVAGFTAQLFEARPQVIPLIVSPDLFAVSRTLITLALLGGMFYVTAYSNDFDREFSLVLLTSMLISPTLFPASMPPLLLVYILLLRQPSRMIHWFVGAAVALLALYHLYLIDYSGNVPVSGLLLSFGFYTLLATWGVNVYLLQGKASLKRVLV